MSENQEQMSERAKWIRPELSTQESVSEVSLNNPGFGGDASSQEHSS